MWSWFGGAPSVGDTQSVVPYQGGGAPDFGSYLINRYGPGIAREVARRFGSWALRDIEGSRKFWREFPGRAARYEKKVLGGKSGKLSVKSGFQRKSMPYRGKGGYKRKRVFRKTVSKKRMRKGNGVTKKFVRASCKALIARKKPEGPLIRRRLSDTGRINQDTYNQFTFGSIRCHTIAHLEDVLEEGSKEVGYNAAHTISQYNTIQQDYDATNREHGFGKMRIQGGGTKILLRNNDLVDVDVCIYEFIAKDFTATDPQSLYEEGVEQKHYDNSVNHWSPMLYPEQFKKYIGKKWKFGKKMKFRLEAGSEKHFFIPYTKGIYNDTFHKKSSSASTYYPHLSQYILIRAQGTLVHDTADNSLVGLSKFQLDMRWECFGFYRFLNPSSLPFDFLNETNDAIVTGEQVQDDVAEEQAI